jgi:molecular chaperone DnaJ
MRAEDIFSMFEDIFGGAFGGAARARGRTRGVPRGYDLETEVELSLEEVLEGTERDVEFRRLDVCETCSGSGAKPGTEPAPCQTCGGMGRVIQQGLGGMFRMETTCPDCRGRGTVVVDKCGDCKGRGRVSVKRRLSVRIPPGVQSGQAVRVQGEGEPPPPELSQSGQGIRGDLHVVVRVQEDDRFEREGDHLLYAAPVSFSQLALGAEIEVPAIDGSAIVAIPPGTQHGAMFRVNERGLPDVRTQQRGDLIVIAQLVVPKRLTESQRKLLEQYADTEDLSVLEKQQEKSGFWSKLRDAMTGH